MICTSNKKGIPYEKLPEVVTEKKKKKKNRNMFLPVFPVDVKVKKSHYKAA